MTKTLSEMMANFTPEEQAEIQAEANQLIAEEMTLRELRKAYHLTQMEIAKNLGVGQDSICKLEKRTDLLLSTLANYIQSLGGSLKLVAEFPENKTFIIKGLADLSDESSLINNEQ
jgi:DNA-binding XRE family transcriptional regulator